MRDFKGVWIPKNLYLTKDLSWSEKILIIEIDSLDNDDFKGCFASNKYLSEFIGVSESSMANMISKLKIKNYIYQVFFDGRNRGLRLHKNIESDFMECESRVHKNVKSDLTKIVKQTTQKNEHSNTVNNTTNNKVKKTIEIIFPFYSDKFRNAWKKWIDYRSETNKSYKSQLSEQTALNQLAEFNETFAIGLIDKSISRGWQGLIFETTQKDFQNLKAVKPKFESCLSEEDKKW